MDVPQDNTQLLVLQQAAGYLNLSVDELLQLGRSPSSSESTGTLGITGRRSHSIRNDSFNDHDIPEDFPAYGPGLWGYNHSSNGDINSQGDVSYYSPGGVPSFARNSFSSSEVVSTGFGPRGHETIELLNPASSQHLQHAQFECNMDMDYHMVHFDDISGSDQNNSSGTDGFVHMQLTPNSQDSDAESESTARDEEMDSGEDDQELSVPSTTDKRSSSSLGSRQYKLIAPRPGAIKTESGSRPGMSGIKARKKRAPYSVAKRNDTNLTRSLNACVRCRIQRNRCVPDPKNPRGPCQPCQQKKTRLSRLPCLRYKLSDSTLFRTGLDYMAFYKAHPMIGPYYGDFHIEKLWIDGPGRFLCLGQGYDQKFLRIELRQFVPPHDPTALDLKGRSMYAVNWAIPDPDTVVEALNEFIDGSIGVYLVTMLGGMDGLVWDIFKTAMESSIFPQPNLLLKKTLRLWVVCRFIESRWRCWADPELEKEDFTAEFPRDPFYTHTSLPPYVDYQLGSIIINRVLLPLREEILRELERMVEKHKPEDWYVTFLTAFILLQNYELQMRFQMEFAKRRNAPVRYLDMSLVRATNSGAKTILAHFHYCCKGQQPFGADFDWNAAKIRRMARLDAEQSRFMAGYRDQVIQRAETFNGINHSSSYDQEYWYTSQLFDPDWTPRDTLEYAPPADWPH